MSEYIRVDWESGSPFFQLVERLISRKARAWRGEPGDALGYVWEHLRRRFQVDDLIDPGKCNLATIVSRKVSNFYTRQEKTPRAGNGWVSLSEVGEPSGLVAKCSETRLAGLTVCCLGGEATP